MKDRERHDADASRYAKEGSFEDATPDGAAPGANGDGHVGGSLAALLDLLRRGFRPVVLKPKGMPQRDRGPAQGKEPFGKGWGLGPFTETKIREDHRRCRLYGEPGSGLTLGPGRAPGGGWLADVEGDGPEAEESRSRLFGGETVETMGWSSRRGGHQLVTLDPARILPLLPRLKGFEVKDGPSPGVFKFPALPGLEIRLGGTKPDGTIKQLQSACPPTRGTDGTPRAWNGVETVAPAPEAFYATLEAIATEAEGAKPEPKPGPKAGATPRAGGGRVDVVSRARAYIFAPGFPDSVAGANGHGRLYHVACVLVDGFGLTEAQARPLFEEWNATKARPPESADQVEHKLADAIRNHPAPSCTLRDARRGRKAAPGRGSTWRRLENHDTYIEPDEKGKDRTVRVPLRITAIAEHLDAIMPGWPKVVGDRPFVRDAEDRPVYLEKPASLFARIHASAGVEWYAGPGYVTKEEFFEHVRMTSESFEAIETIPHWPSMPGIYYLHPPLPAPGGKLDGLLNFFKPASPLDRELMRAFLLTCFWGGPPDSRPCFMTTGIEKDVGQGRGIGKSTFFTKLAEKLVGRLFEVSIKDDIADIKERILSGDEPGRVGIIDNLKTLKFSWGEFEGLVTSPRINGRALYHGNRSVPNAMVWAITVNAGSFSKDMALRTVIIKLARPTYQPTWEAELDDYLLRHRWEIIAEVGQVLTGRPPEVMAKTRWAAWEQGVLAHVATPAACAAEIVARQQAIDHGDAEQDLVAEHFATTLKDNGYPPESCSVFIPSKVAAAWVSDVLREHYDTGRASAKLKELAIPELTYEPKQRKVNGQPSRGWIWLGKDANPEAKTEVFQGNTW
jgi:hypothetical protein